MKSSVFCWMVRSGDYVWDDSNQCWNADMTWGRRFFKRRDAARFIKDAGLSGTHLQRARPAKVSIAFVDDSTPKRST